MRAVQIIYPRAIWYEAILLDEIQEVLNDVSIKKKTYQLIGPLAVKIRNLSQSSRFEGKYRRRKNFTNLLAKIENKKTPQLAHSSDSLRDLRKAPPTPQQALEDPEAVPVVGLAEAAARDDEGALDGDEAVDAAVALPGADVAARQVRPDVDDLLGELADDAVVDGVQEGGVRLEVLGRHRLELGPGLPEVRRQELVQLRVVAQRLAERLEGGEHLVEGLLRWSDDLFIWVRL